MALGIVSDEEFLAEAQHVIMPAKGRGNIRAVPDVIRALAAEEAICGTTIKDTAEQFGISPASVSAYKNDATSTASYDKPDKDLKRANDAVRKQVNGTALSILMSAMKCITPDKLDLAKVRDVAAVAKDMSTIMTNIEPVGSMSNPGAQFVFHVPSERKEDAYDVIEVTQ